MGTSLTPGGERNPRRNTKNTKKSDAIFGYLIPVVLIGLTIADFLKDGSIDKYLIGALLIVGLGALGYRIDTLIETYIQARAQMLGGGEGPEENEPPPRKRIDPPENEDEDSQDPPQEAGNADNQPGAK